MKRVVLCLLFCLLIVVSPAVLADEEGKKEEKLPTVDLDMLVFESVEHFRTTMDELKAEQELWDELYGDFETDDRELPIFQDFANGLGFESLLIYLEWLDTNLDSASFGEPGRKVDESFDPDHHHIFSSYLRGLVNPQSEIMIGSTIYRLHPEGYYKIENRDKAILDQIREGKKVDDGDGVTFIAHPRGGGGCCRQEWSQEETHSYADGDRRLKIKSWIKDYDFYSEVGSRTINQRKGWFGWKRTKADIIGVRGSAMLSDGACMLENHYDFNVQRSNKKKAEKELEQPNGVLDFSVKDYFDTTHWAEDAGDALMVTMSMCDCREANAAFSLPTMSNDSANVVMNGTASSEEDRHFIEIYETNAVGSHTVTGPYWSNWFSGQVGTVNLANHYDFSGAIGTARVYRVKLAVQNGCTNWDERVRWITVFDAGIKVKYRAHVKSHGWLDWVFDGETAGTTGQSRRMEALQAKLLNAPADMQICYRAHVKGDGWLNEVCDGATAGTTGESRRMEAVQIRLLNAPSGCSVRYRAHVKGEGWLGWVSDGATAGTTGESRRMEAVRIELDGC